MRTAKLKDRIYKAQCIGNVEPIEYMVPYPNLRALIDGQNIKYGQKMVYVEQKLTSDKLYRMAQQTANWLQSKGVAPKDRVMLESLSFPWSEIAALGTWTLGCSLVFSGDKDFKGAHQATSPAYVISQETDLLSQITSFPEYFNPNVKSLLKDEAVVFWNQKIGYRYSHYNILVNTNGVQHALSLYEDQSFFVKLDPSSMPWIVLQIVLPLYSGAPIDEKKADITIGEKDSDYNLQFEWLDLSSSKNNALNVCYENTAFISIGKEPIHLTAVDNLMKPREINGHSVMMGYVDDESNEKMFTGNALRIAR